MQITLASIFVNDQDHALFDAEYKRLKARGVVFRGGPASMGPVTAVLFEDSCGNLINLVQPH
jgi:hypothetical protein